MNKILNYTLIISLLFSGIVLLVFLMNYLGLFFSVSFTVIIMAYFIYKILVNKRKVEKFEVMKLLPYYVLVFLFSGIDMLITKFFISSGGVSSELNITIKNLYLWIGNYTFIVIPFVALFFIMVLSILVLKKSGLKDSIVLLKIVLGFYTIIFIWNLVM